MIVKWTYFENIIITFVSDFAFLFIAGMNILFKKLLNGKECFLDVLHAFVRESKKKN